jgi:hypothetical protein
MQPVLWPKEPSRISWRKRPQRSGPNSLAQPAGGFARCDAKVARLTSGELRFNTSNRSVIARHAAGIFFPQRPGLRLTPHSFSPSILHKIVRSSAREISFQEAAESLEELADVTISARQASRIAQEIGQQLQTQRDQHVAEFEAGKLKAQVETRPALAVVGVDGGRLQIRSEGDGPGAHDSSWREDKISVLATAAITSFDSDPEPNLPDCFRNREYVQKLVRGICGQSQMSPADSQDATPVESSSTITDHQHATRERPELLVRTYVASMSSSEEFGPMVAAEAKRRNFANAVHRVFLGDGAAWIWKLQREYFPTFQAIVDFLHVLGHVFAAAKAATTETDQRWALFESWAEACWQGQVDRVIEELRALRDDLGLLPEAEVESLADDDPRKLLAQELGYLEHNRERMDYPRYRQEGLPWTSSHVESTVKLFNRRVKGSEKFWGERGAEAILQLRAAFLSEDDRLAKYLKTRPCSPFRTYKDRKNKQAA